MQNECEFSECRRYRYSLRHEVAPILSGSKNLKWIAWIGLNPSTADEGNLDPTLRRIRGFTSDWGFDGFVMLNLFAFRATDPTVMKAEPEPVGADNDRIIDEATQGIPVVFCWGKHGDHLSRGESLAHRLLSRRDCHYLKLNGDGSPAHPLYLSKKLKLTSTDEGTWTNRTKIKIQKKKSATS